MLCADVVAEWVRQEKDTVDTSCSGSRHKEEPIVMEGLRLLFREPTDQTRTAPAASALRARRWLRVDLPMALAA